MILFLSNHLQYAFIEHSQHQNASHDFVIDPQHLVDP